MPTYDYRCKQCGTTHEIAHGFNDPRPTTCPSCGGALARVFHPVGVVFKGSGFHKTDYSSSGLKKESADTGAAKTDSAASSDKPKGDKPGGDAKPASDAKPAPASPSAAKPDAKSSGTGKT
ncbi:MAG: FmdB family transcriptional regulator [Candidatus Eremiobacteraeota bacterium]|nr:FmdB family transcriptional regulator [Candidatus Eremiobacteraeota bacterium]MBV8366594.1 FmdB family transcriptional regulator [Candidatus Eremiobacteraeota bacterium]